MPISELYQIFKEYPVICTDSQMSLPNSLFFAVKTYSYDGNKFASGFKRNKVREAPKEAFSLPFVDTKLYLVESTAVIKSLVVVLPLIRSKGELYDYLRQFGGKIFIHKENTHLQSIARGANPTLVIMP